MICWGIYVLQMANSEMSDQAGRLMELADQIYGLERLNDSCTQHLRMLEDKLDICLAENKRLEALIFQLNGILRLHGIQM